MEGVRKLTVGAPEDDCDITPVVTGFSANFIEGLVIDAKQQGATFLTEFKREGNLIWPLVLDNITKDMRIAWEVRAGWLLGGRLLLLLLLLPLARVGHLSDPLPRPFSMLFSTASLS